MVSSAYKCKNMVLGSVRLSLLNFTTCIDLLKEGGLVILMMCLLSSVVN